MPFANKIDIEFLRGYACFTFFEYMKRANSGFKFHGVDGSISAALIVLYNFEHACAAKTVNGLAFP